MPYGAVRHALDRRARSSGRLPLVGGTQRPQRRRARRSLGGAAHGDVGGDPQRPPGRRRPPARRSRPGGRGSASARSVSGSGSSSPRSVMTAVTPPPRHAEPLARAWAVAEADRGAEVEPLDERARRLLQDHERLLARRRDLGRAAGARQPHLRVVVGADHGAVEVARSGRSGRRRGSRRRSGRPAASRRRSPARRPRRRPSRPARRRRSRAAGCAASRRSCRSRRSARTRARACARARFAALLGRPMPTKQTAPSRSRRAAATAIISSRVWSLTPRRLQHVLAHPRGEGRRGRG